MTQDELINLSSKLSSANRWGATCVTVKLKNGNDYLVPVEDINDYQENIKK